MDFHQYVIDVSKLGIGDVWELAEGLKDFDPDKLELDFIQGDLYFDFHGDELDKQNIDDFIGGYADVKWDYDCD